VSREWFQRFNSENIKKKKNIYSNLIRLTNTGTLLVIYLQRFDWMLSSPYQESLQLKSYNNNNPGKKYFIYNYIKLYKII